VGNDDRVLSQAEIDALLSSSSVSVPAKPAGPPPASKAAAPATPAAPLKAAPAAVVAPAPPKAAVAPPPAPKAAPAPAAVAPPKPAAPAPAPVRAPAPAPAAAQSVREGPTPEQVTNLCKKIVSDETRDLAKQIIELTIKVKKIDDVKQRMEQVEEKLDQIAEMVQSSPKAVRALGTRMDELYNLLEGMQQGSRQGDEERIHDQFHCVKCHSEKLVAIHVKCTSCGMENWMGWFPDGSQREVPHQHTTREEVVEDLY
jgi:hypothetical protein